jgi:hypothetical protein
MKTLGLSLFGLQTWEENEMGPKSPNRRAESPKNSPTLFASCSAPRRAVKSAV